MQRDTQDISAYGDEGARQLSYCDEGT
jgi:hypothetical protein